MAEKRNDGGPAFPLENPRQLEDGALFKQFSGMSLRDWFAGQVLAGYLANPEIASANPSTMARDCYAIADAMLTERALPPEVRS